MLSLYQEGYFPQIRNIVVSGLREVTRDAMIASHLMGVKMERNLFPKSLKLSSFDPLLKQLAKQLGLDLRTLEAQYDTQALRVLHTASDEIESRLQESVYELIQNGATVPEARKVLGEEFDKLGLTTENDYQLETIYRTQSQLAFQAGRWEQDQAPEIQEILWGYEYVAVMDNRTRESHVALDGTRAPKDDPIWERIWPPNGWNCRCSVIPILNDDELATPKEPEDGGEADDGFEFNPGRVFGSGNLPVVLSHKSSLIGLCLAYDESKHPRGKDGRFINITSADGWTKTGPQLGSNPGFQAIDPDTGIKYYVKVSKDVSHTRNEILAAQLYEAAGIAAPKLKEVTVGGKSAIASEWNAGLTQVSGKELSKEDSATAGFATDAWLANWDTMGIDGSNIQVDEKTGIATRADVGGALDYRAQGAEKGAKFGDKVTELDSLRSTAINPMAAKVFGKMSDEQIAESIRDHVAKVDDKTIQKLVKNQGGDEALAAKLIARKEDLIKWADAHEEGVKQDAPVSKQAAVAVAPTPSGYPVTHTDVIKAAGGVTTGQAEKIKALAALSTNPKEILVPLACNKAQVAAIQAAYPGHTVKTVNALKMLANAKGDGTASTPTPAVPKLNMKALNKATKPYPKSGPTVPPWMAASAGMSTPAAPAHVSPPGFPPIPKTNVKSKMDESLKTAQKEWLAKDSKMNSAIAQWKGSSSYVQALEKRSDLPGGITANTPKGNDGAKDQEKLNTWQKGMKNGPKYQGVTYRGIHISESSPGYKALTDVGSTYEFKTSQSTSLSSKAAFGFGDVVMRIKGKSGVAINAVHGFEDEHEVIMPKGTKHRVVAVHKKIKIGNNTVTMVDLEEI